MPHWISTTYYREYGHPLYGYAIYRHDFQPIRGGQDRFLHSLHVCLSSNAKILERGKEYRGG